MPLAIKKNKKYTYADYCSWNDNERWELIDGVPYNMTPAPTRFHEDISGFIFNFFYNYLKDKNCRVYDAPFDVRFSTGRQKDDEILNVVQPDISIICSQKKLDERGCIGAPDLIVEILSPSTAARDMKTKFGLYERHGVKEYWIIHPEEKIIEIFILKNKKNGRPSIYSFDDKIKASIFGNCVIDMREFKL